MWSQTDLSSNPTFGTFLAVGPAASLIFLSLFPVHETVNLLFGQLAGGGAAKPAMTGQGHGEPSGSPFGTRCGFCLGLLGGLRCFPHPCTQ